MSSQGPNGPSTGASVSAGGAAWTSPGNITANDGSNASCSLFTGVGAFSDYLQATGFGFSIPSTATIQGIKVDVVRSVSGMNASSITDKSVKLLVGGSASGNDKASGSTWVKTGETASYGSSADTWGLALTASQVNASNFGVQVQAQTGAADTEGAQVDYIQITVSYSLGGAGGLACLGVGK